MTQIAVKERPIPFSTEMVKAIRDGRKTQTRGVVKDPRRGSVVNPKSSYSMGGIYSIADRGAELRLEKDTKPNYPCPYGQAGDRLWVRETFFIDECRGDDIYGHDGPVVFYRATDFSLAGKDDNSVKWRPSIHMPRWASRITLEITELRVERLQEITEADARAEGDPKQGLIASENSHTVWFRSYWDSIINKKYPYNWSHTWAGNPWVWVISFREI